MIGVVAVMVTRSIKRKLEEMGLSLGMQLPDVSEAPPPAATEATPAPLQG